MCVCVLMYVIIIFLLVYVQHGEVLITNIYAHFLSVLMFTMSFEIMHFFPLQKILMNAKSQEEL